MTVVEVAVTREMALAGLEALKEARAHCLPDAEVVTEIFLAMYGCSLQDPETWH